MAKSPRILNPNYFPRILLRDELRGMAATVCTSLGVDTRHPKREGMEYITLKPSMTVCIQKNYKGWTVPGKLYCVRCWRVQNGIPREIILRNWCSKCDAKLYKDDPESLDYLGNRLYRDRITRLTQVGAKHFHKLIKGNANLWKNGVAAPGYNFDHILSVRESFELDLDESMVSAPCNVQIMEIGQNYKKGRKSELSRGELEQRYADFLRENPHWPKLVEESDNAEPLFTIADFVDPATGQIRNGPLGNLSITFK